jgi:hypothetical protein
MISIKTTALIMAVSSILGVAPIAALAQQNAAIDDRDFNAQANFAQQDFASGQANIQGIGEASPQVNANTQTGVVAQSNTLNDQDVNTIVQNSG